MPFVVGVALNSLSAGNPIFIEVISTDDEKSSYSFQQEILDSSDLTPTFEKIANSIPGPFVSPVTLSFPSYLTDEEKEELVKTVNAAPAFSSMWVRVVDNIHTTLVALKEVPYPPQIELALEIGPDAATARLISTLVEDGIREITVEKEVIIRDIGSIGSADLIALLVDPALAALKGITTQAEPGNFKVVANDPRLKRVLILDFSSTFTSSLVQELKSKFQQISPPVEILVEKNLARYTADSSLDQYWRSNGVAYVYNTNPLRVGIIKADGFVLTVMEKNRSFPLKKTVIFTTSQDQQSTATIKVVVGIPPKGADNTVIAELILEDLIPRPKGVPRIKVTFDVELMGKTRIMAEELMEEGGIAGSTASIQLKEVIGDTMTANDVYDIHARYADFVLANASYHDAVIESESQWAGKEVLGDLPL